jgi:hypothetical protein
MNKYQTNVLWLGLILITLNVIVNIGTFKSVLFSGPSNTGGVIGGYLGPALPAGTPVKTPTTHLV